MGFIIEQIPYLTERDLWKKKAREMYPLGTPKVQAVQYVRFEEAQRKLLEIKKRKNDENKKLCISTCD
jgi:hypothetical protein